MSDNYVQVTAISGNAGGSHNVTQSGYNGDTTGSMAIQASSHSIGKGGMRGIGLIAVAIAEAKLKRDSVELAEDYYDLNKKDFDSFVATHEGPIAQTVAEAMSNTANPKHTYDLFASVPAGIAKAGIADAQWFETRRRADRYSIGIQMRIDYEFALMRTHGIVAGWNIGTRYEINYTDEHNNRQFDRKIAASNIGIGVGNIVRQGLASSVATLAAARDNLGDTIATIGNGLAAKGGYEAGRKLANDRYESMTQSGIRNDVSGEKR